MVRKETKPSSEKGLQWMLLQPAWQWGSVLLGQGNKEMSVGCVSAVVTVVVGSAWRRGGVWLVVELSKRCGIVGGGVDVSLLEGRRVQV